MKRHLLHLALSLALLLGVTLITSCATKGVKPGAVDSAKSQKVEPEARKLYAQAERAYETKNYPEGRRLFSNLRATFPKGSAAVMASYRLGTILYYQEDYYAAAREFESFLSVYPDSDLTFDVTYNLAAAEFQLNQPEKAYESLSRLKRSDIQAQGPRRAEVIYSLTAQVATTTGRHAAKGGGDCTALLQHPRKDAGKRAKWEASVDDHINKIDSRTELEGLAQEVGDGSTRTKIQNRMASLGMEAPKPTAPAPLPVIGTPEVSPPTATLTSNNYADRLSVGALLPLTGKSAPYGKRALEGILLAAGVYSKSRDAEIKVFVEDTASNPATAAGAVDSLVKNHQVMAIIGPLSWKEAIAVGERCQELGVVNLSLTGKEGISEKGPYLFQNALTPKTQLDSMVEFAVVRKGYKRLAVLAPNNSFGKKTWRWSFGLSPKEYGAHIVASTKPTPPTQKTFRFSLRR